MSNHKWDDQDVCVKCGCLRTRHTRKLLMAIVGNKNYYRYERIWIYSPALSQWQSKRPDCVMLNSDKNPELSVATDETSKDKETRVEQCESELSDEFIEKNWERMVKFIEWHNNNNKTNQS